MRILLPTVLLCAALATAIEAAKIKIRVDYDKAFDFTATRTYKWHPAGAGDVKLIENSGDNAASLRARFEPVIMRAVEQSLASRKFTAATTAPPDLHVSYYLLVGPNISAQTMGQFLGPVPVWGVPPFAGATQSLEIYEQGTLLLDLSSAAEDRMVWRGSAQAQIDRQNSDTLRDARIRSAVQDMLKKFPPKK